MEYAESKDRKVYNIDFDGTLTIAGSYTDLQPDVTMIQKVRELYYSGHIIIIWSARLWESSNDIAGWCIMQKVPFHGLMLGKGGTDCYIDDKAVNSVDFKRDLTKKEM